MQTVLRLITLCLLALASATIVFIVNAPKWLDGVPVATTRRV